MVPRLVVPYNERQRSGVCREGFCVSHPQTFAELLKRYRVRARLSQEELAERTQLSARAISNLERGFNRSPRSATVRLLAEALGLSEQERETFETAARGGSTPAQPPSARPHGLPVQLTPFIGRGREVDEVGGRLLRSDVRLLTLTGPGGTGKTRLALQVAAAVTGEFSDGVYFVDLSTIAQPELVPAEIAHTLGLKEHSPRPLLESLEEHLGEKQVLMVLDNFEQVVLAGSFLAQLLVTCPQLKVLATSRIVLRVSGEHLYPVPPMTLPDPRCPLPPERLAECEAVRLFLTRAQARKPGFQVTPENASAVTEICRRLDGLPLAIELAAARAGLLSPQAMLARLGDRLALLTGGAQDLPTRQQTVRATLDWSYDLLGRPERSLLGTLSVFAGGAGLEAAEAVCGPDGDAHILGGLSSLVDQSLVRQEERSGGEIRFGMLETVRDYALARLAESGEWGPAHRRHAEYYLRLVEAAEAELHGPRQSDWLRRVDEETDNVRSALRWSQESGQTGLGLRLGSALRDFWRLRGRMTEGRAWLEGLLASQESSGLGVQEGIRARAMGAGATLAWAQGDFRRAEQLATEGLMLNRKQGHPAGVADTLHTLASVAHGRGEYRRAEGLYGEALALYRDLGDRMEVSSALNDLGMLARDLGDWARSRTLHEESLAIRQALGGESAIAQSLYNLGLAAHLQGDYEQAEIRLAEGLALFRDLGDVLGVADSLNDLGRLPQVRRDWRRAVALFEEALSVYQGLGDERGAARTLNNLGLIAYDRGEYERAVELHEESHSIHSRLGSRWGAGISLYDLGNALHALGNLERAGEAYQEALRLMREAGDQALVAFCLEGLARVALSCGLPARTARLCGAADALRATIKAPLPPPDRPLHERTLAEACRALGEERFAQDWEQGRGMAMEQAVRYTLDPTAE